MANIKNLEMAAALSQNPHIEIKKSLFSTKAIYTPTGSKLEVNTLEYAPADGERMEHLLALPAEKIEVEVKTKGKPKATPVGQYRLETAISSDHQFAAVQLFRFVDFGYTPASQLICCEGKDVAVVESLL